MSRNIEDLYFIMTFVSRCVRVRHFKLIGALLNFGESESDDGKEDGIR